MDLSLYATLAAVSFAAAVVQAATGFGFGVLAVPVFLLAMGSLAAIQVVAAISLAMSLVLIPFMFKDAPPALMGRLVAGSLIGFPVGLVAFRAADVGLAKLVVGAIIATFALWLSWREWRGRSCDTINDGPPGFESKPLPELGVGVASGAMASALAMPGPAVILYLAARRPGKRMSRAVTLTLLGFSYTSVCLLHTVWGGMDGRTWLLALTLAPFVLAGAGAGHIAARALSEQKFRLVVLAILATSGFYAIWTTF